ncbi:MAG: HAMP domain-containing protein, partial [Rickettsiales bacterium]|nr:HAMP domain-containing protein [Rickettsiales bacterium]
MQDLHFNAANPLVHQAIRDFSTAWKMIGDNPTEALQRLYIEDNPNPAGQKEGLDYALDNSLYSIYHKKYHPWFRTFLRDRGYYDIFLFDMEGNLVYTVFKELDYATNLNTGQWRGTDLGNAFRAAASGNAEEVFFFDFKPYAPSHDAPASFISTLIVDAQGQKIGVLAYQMPVDAINAIMQSRDGLGETGQTYIVGQDLLMRSNAPLASEATLLSQKVDTVAARESVNGNEGHWEGISYNGVESRAAYHPLPFMGTTWGVIAEQSMVEVLAPVNAAITALVLKVIGFSVLAALIAIFIGRSISKRASALANAVKEIAAGNSVEIPSLKDKDEIGTIASSLKTINELGQASYRVQCALDNTTVAVMIADENNIIRYMNSSVLKLMQESADEVRKELPKFDPNNLIGISIDNFHKNPEKQRGMLAHLTSSYETSICVGDLRFDLIATPVFNNNKERIGTVVQWADVTEERRVEGEIAGVVSAVSRGDFNQQLSTEGRQGFILSLCEGINKISETSLNGLSEIREVLQSLADGNLTRQVEGRYEGMFDEIKNALNDTIKQLKNMVMQIMETAESVNSAANEIAAGGQDLSHRTERQASTLEETAASMEELTTTVRQNSENAQEANGLAGSAQDIATNGGNVVQNAVSAMDTIRDSSQKIADIIGVIDDIAFQTNLLALNAAVEAARAGEAGKGFAVVAQEVRALAGRSASASREIKELINSSVGQVKDGAELVNRSGKALEEIVSSVKNVAELVANIAGASKEQSSSIEEINVAVKEMDDAVQQNAALVEESTAAAGSMTE